MAAQDSKAMNAQRKQRGIELLNKGVEPLSVAVRLGTSHTTVYGWLKEIRNGKVSL